MLSNGMKKGFLSQDYVIKYHLYYGAYFPTRFDHLLLFDNWLNRYKGSKKTAIDAGIGSDV